jgi:hypothetical protein
MPINSFLYPGAKVVPPFTVANSLRFDGSSSNLSRTKGTSDSTKIGTYSWWIKNSKFTGQNLIDCGDAFANSASVYISSNNTLSVYARVSNTNVLVLETDREFRDPSAWHNIVVAIDTTQSTASNRAKVYVDGVQQTSFSTETYPDQNADLRFFTSSETEKISSTVYETGGFFGGYMCEVVKVDGQALAPTSFGQFNEDSPTVWEPIDVAGLTFGTNGYYLDFEDSSNLGNNVAGGTDFTENNIAATDQSTDTCTNNGCTWNTLIRSGATFSEGNLVYQAPSSNPVFGSLTTFGVNSGKWYAECKYHAGSNHYGIIGIADEVFAVLSGLGSVNQTDLGKTGAALGSDPNDCTVAYVINTGKIRNNNNNQDYGSGGGDGDIINIALDRDNRKVYFGINGTYENSGNPGSGSNGFDLSSQVTGDTYFLGVTNDTGASETILDFNFGSGFGLTAVSSGNSDANGYGNFEYAVPSGFYAWNSKNLAEFG